MPNDYLTVTIAHLKRHKVVRLREDRFEALVVWNDADVAVYNGICPHLGGPLLEADIADGKITCPWHAYVWDLSSGRCLTRPGEMWDDVDGFTRPDTPYSRPLVPLRFDMDEHEIRIPLPKS